ncbi:MAG: type II CAAX endopeptidase family protein [Bacilli bacterium]
MKTTKILKPCSCIIIYLFLSTLMNIYIKSLINTTNFFLLNIVNLIAPLVICIILILLNKNELKNKFKDYKINFKKYLKIMIKYYLIGVLLMILSNNIIILILKSTAINESLNREIITKLPIYATISILFLGPISEELTFRASFKKLFTNEFLFSIVTAVIFGLIHVLFNGDLLFAVPYAALGFFFAKAYYQTNNILVSITMHSFHNLLCLLLIFIGGLM